jgi:hypothetical protein
MRRIVYEVLRTSRRWADRGRRDVGGGVPSSRSRGESLDEGRGELNPSGQSPRPSLALSWVASTVLGWGWKARPAMGTRRPRVRSRGAGGGRRRARDARVLRRAGRGGCAHSQRSRSGPMVSLSRQRLAPLVPGLEDAFMRPVARDTEALQLLTRYVRLFDQQSLAAPELRSPMVNHVYDLVALALGATRDAVRLRMAAASGPRACMRSKRNPDQLEPSGIVARRPRSTPPSYSAPRADAVRERRNYILAVPARRAPRARIVC